MTLPTRVPRRRVTGPADSLFRYERALQRSGFIGIAGVDEAGRGACAGPLVVGAAILDVTSTRTVRALGELADSKLLTPAARERVYDQVTAHAVSWSTVIVPPQEVDRIGLHVANIEGMRRALARLDSHVDYVLSDGFAVPGLAMPNLGVWKGDQVCGCVSAAGVLAKVTRDRIMVELDAQWPQYGFGVHKGYVTSMHREALAEFGPSPVHRQSFAPVRRAQVRHDESGARTELISREGAA
ncbi:MAG TPA: ribonuclease HII [Actinobacteria bacterium]|nr:ribonuclease HII [Actinomycetota bacterium]